MQKHPSSRRQDSLASNMFPFLATLSVTPPQVFRRKPRADADKQIEAGRNQGPMPMSLSVENVRDQMRRATSTAALSFSLTELGVLVYRLVETQSCRELLIPLNQRVDEQSGPASESVKVVPGSFYR